MKKLDKDIIQAFKDRIELIKSGATANPFETKAEQQERIFLAKKDIRFCANYYFEEYASAESAEFQIELAEMVKKNLTIKALIRWGRGLAKSVWSDLIIPFWLWINDETFYMVLVGNNFDKARILLGDLQAEFEANPRIIHDYGEQINKGDWTKGYFRTKNGFVCKALGMGQSPRGLRLRARRPDLIICDDLEDRETAKNPARQKEIVKWIEQDLIPTMDGPRRRYLHPNNDFAPVTIQNLLEKKHIRDKKKPKWILSRVDAFPRDTEIPAWASKYTREYYLEIIDELGDIAFNAEYNNDGVIEGEIFKEEMIQWAKRPDYDHFDALMGVWDVAYSGNNDFNAIPVWGLKDRELWKCKQFCKQCKMAAAIDWMYAFQESLPSGAEVVWGVEKQFWTDPVKEALEDAEIRHGYSLNILEIERSGMNKFLRILTMHPLYQAKRIYYSESERKDNDMKVANAQLFGIDYGYNGHDDAPDGDEMTIHELLQVSRSEKPERSRITSRKAIISRQKNRF
ncbi:hypothetical protein [Pelobium manganitolerans]|uniref:hypothetical protein n=1 Tax=Pelobium manganitolerans TaxID=1842495 RepID=UPI003FA3C44F